MLSAGDVGYIISGIKNSAEVKVGDTITHVARPCHLAISGFADVKPMVFAGIYPVDADDYEDLRASIEKLQLNDASLTFVPESSAALGFGFRCGFLGLLHMEIVQERLDREFDMDVITTVPNVSFRVLTTRGERSLMFITLQGCRPSPQLTRSRSHIFTRRSFRNRSISGPILKLCIDKRGTLKNQVYLTSDRVEVTFDMPLSEIVFDFYDKLKSISKGYASFDYHITDYKKADLVRLDILLNGEMVDALSTLIYRGHAYDFGTQDV